MIDEKLCLRKRWNSQNRNNSSSSEINKNQLWQHVVLGLCLEKDFLWYNFVMIIAYRWSFRRRIQFWRGNLSNWMHLTIDFWNFYLCFFLLSAFSVFVNTVIMWSADWRITCFTNFSILLLLLFSSLCSLCLIHYLIEDWKMFIIFRYYWPEGGSKLIDCL